MKEFIQEFEQLELGKCTKKPSLSKYTTYRVGGIADCMVYPKNIDALIETCKLIKKYHLAYKVVGKGSNLLFSDAPYHGVIIKLDAFDKVSFYEHKVRVGAGFSLVRLASMAAKKSLTGLEFASGIPGTVGGAIFMNAGAYKSDMGYIVQSIKVLTPDLKVITLTNQELAFHYRTSFLQKHPNYICLEAVLRLQKGKKEAIETVMRERRERRKESQPLEYPSAGSVFRNPENALPAGKLIEDLGLKGLQKGGAQVSKKHANFIINYQNAQARDIHDLILFVQDAIKEHYGIHLKIEQEFVNWETKV